MAEVSSAPAPWPVSGEQIDSGIASRPPASVIRVSRASDIRMTACPVKRPFDLEVTEPASMT
jgi:hypothetical protein